eukprot:372766-Alexandrium_andersonii.AAC.1
MRTRGMLIRVTVKTQTQVAQSSVEAVLGGVHRGAVLGVCAQSLWGGAFGQRLPIIFEIDSSS